MRNEFGLPGLKVLECGSLKEQYEAGLRYLKE
jgi:hypothetical protein